MSLVTSDGDIRGRVGADRVLRPAGALPQPAEALDASGPCRAHEIEVEVELLSLDSTSARQLSAAADGDSAAVAARIEEIVGRRGKMHNPVTDSGGVLVGRVRAVGSARAGAPEIGTRICACASLTCIPLSLDAVGPVHAGSPLVPAHGTAYLAGTVAWTAMPEDFSVPLFITVLDVCAVVDPVMREAASGATVLVLGAGHAGKLAMAAAREAVGPSGTIVAVDADPATLDALADWPACDVRVRADLRDAVGTVGALAAAGVAAADLTVVVVNATGCEAAAILATSPEGTIVFFSMATNFSTVALTADGLSSGARLLIGSGYSSDQGARALEIVRRDPVLRTALDAPAAGTPTRG